METTLLNEPIVDNRYPSLSDRVQSSFIDMIVIIVLMFLFSSQLDKYENVPDWIRIVLFFGLWAVYEPLGTTLGCTVGNYIKGIRVKRYSNYQKRINFFQAFFRYTIKIALGWFSFLTIHSNKEKRALHDLAVGSVMMKHKA